jgi:hypothetical protein
MEGRKILKSNAVKIPKKNFYRKSICKNRDKKIFQEECE